MVAHVAGLVQISSARTWHSVIHSSFNMIVLAKSVVFALPGGQLHLSMHWVSRRYAAQLLQLQTLPRLHSVSSASMDYSPRIHSQVKQMDGMQCLLHFLLEGTIRVNVLSWLNLYHSALKQI